MNFKYIKNILPVAALALTAGLSSCTKDLDVTPIDPSTVMTVDEPGLYTKCYANFALAGNGGANGDCDIDGLDGGTTGYVRQLFNANELTTDESICGWGDNGISAFDFNSWDSSHPMLKGFYNRLYTGIAYCNHYLDVCKDVDATRQAEVRFIRCLNYYFLMDCFGNVPFTLELSSETPHQIKRADLFAWIEAELLGKAVTIYAMDDPSYCIVDQAADEKSALVNLMLPSKGRTSSDADYGRVDVDGANLLLARMYLNAEVYTGTARWQEAESYAEKVISGEHKLNTKGENGWSAYQMLFMGNNGENGASVEAIFPLLQDGKTTTSWGTSLFLMASTWQSDMDTEGNYGTTEFWSGNRCRSQLLEKFFPNGAPNVTIKEMTQAAGDDRALFYGVDRSLKVTTWDKFTSGFSCGKYRNTYSDGSTPHSSQFVDMDYFLMRSAEAYLIAAECDARLNGGMVTSKGKAYIDALRTRAYASARANYSTDDILDERARELYYEGFRRTDLIRYGYFGGANSGKYLWDYKGSQTAPDGAAFDAHFNVFAIPAEDINANPKLTQNDKY